MGHTVLLVDDDAGTLEGLERALQREPYRILAASSADQALKIFESAAVDVIVSDEKMPGMSGTELLARVRRRYPGTMRVMLTGHASIEAALQAINEGEVFRFLTKPCNHIDLAVTIRHALQQKTLMDEARRLLRTLKRQAALLEELERVNPGITSVRTTPDGAIVLDDDLPGDFSGFMKEVNTQADLAEKRIGREP
jgi:two-component system probable response regulator PhcQ